MFVDDMGIFVYNSEENYNRIRDVISEYERCSRAKLNASKSELIPLFEFPLLDWIYNIGCCILRAGEVTKYLGCPIGLAISLAQELDLLLGKVQKRLRHWSNKLLSFPSKVTLIKHVLRVMLYSFMAYSFSLNGFKRLEGVCRYSV